MEMMKIRETSKANAVAMRGLAAGTEEVRRVNNYETEDTDEEIQILEKELRVMKLRKQGKYSGRKGGGSK
jgi:hypothetical protein